MDSSVADKRTSNRQNFNIQNVTCYTFPQHLVLDWTAGTVDHMPRLLRIDRKTAQFAEIDRRDINFESRGYTFRSFSSFFGIIELQGFYHLLFCEECSEATKESSINIYEIQSIYLMKLATDEAISLSGKKQSILAKATDLSQLLSRGFYFSHDYNITQTREHQDSHYKEEFTWNKNCLQELSKGRNLRKEWIVPVIQGYVCSLNCFLQGRRLDYVLISRRSWHKGGTRYFDRGLDEEGWVANFVQSQQLIFLEHYVVSEVQIRGSVPIFFQQRGITTKVNISRSNTLSRQSFKKHFDYCRKLYDRTFCVNLLSMKKGGEKTIIQQYERHIKEDKDPDVHYFYYDFHQQCGNQFSKVNEAIQKLAAQKQNLCFFLFDKESNSVLSRQMGIFRTNCLDCLDRTNFVQAKLALMTLEFILRCFSIDMSKMFSRSAIEEMDQRDNTHSFIKSFKSIWADNGDMISYHYTGTGSTHTDITREGTRSFTGAFKHKFKTITRFYNQLFWDFQKMRMIDILLQNQTESQGGILQRMKQRESEYSNFQTVRAFNITWKVSGLNPPTDKQINFGLKDFDMLVVGLQQLQSISMWNMSGFTASTGSDRVKKWEAYFEKCLESQKKAESRYILISRSFYGNNALLVYGKDKDRERFTEIESCEVAFSNYQANKSAVISRFELDDTELAFVSCQLDYGREYSKNRQSSLRQLFKKAFQHESVGRLKSHPLHETETVILMGNLNFNIMGDEAVVKSKLREVNAAYQEIRGLIKITDMQKQKSEQMTKKITDLLKEDQFSQLKLDFIEPFQQATIDFIPPYKYEKGKYKLDESKCGGWVDRIVYSTRGLVKCLEYNVQELFVSDHLPVYCLMEIRIAKEDPSKKKAIYEGLLKELKINMPLEEQPQDVQL